MKKTLIFLSEHRYTFISIASAILILCVYCMIWGGSVDKFVRSVDHGGVIFEDFVIYFYPAGDNAIRTHTPSIFVYPAFAAIILWPMGRMPLLTAMTVWGLIQVISSLFLFALPYRHLRGSWHEVIYTMVFFTSYPLLHNFKWGQFSTIITSMIMLGILVQERKELTRATLLSFAVSIKYYPALFFSLLAAQRRYRTLALAMAISCVFIFLVPMALMGPGGLNNYNSHLADNYINLKALTMYNFNSQYLTHVIYRWKGMLLDNMTSSNYVEILFNWKGLSADKSTSFIAMELAGYLIPSLNLFLLWRVLSSSLRQREWLGMILLFASIPFLIPSSWPHYFVYLPASQMILLKVSGKELTGARTRVTTAVLTVLSIVLSSVFTFIAVGGWPMYNLMGLPFLSNLFLLAGTYLFIARSLFKAKPAPLAS